MLVQILALSQQENIMNLSQAKALKSGTVLHSKTYKNADGTPLRGRVNGAVKTWKRDANRIKVPMKHGLKNCFYLTEQSDTQNENYQDWVIA